MARLDWPPFIIVLVVVVVIDENSTQHPSPRNVPFFLLQWSLFEDYTCGSYYSMGYQPMWKAQGKLSKGFDFNLSLSSLHIAILIQIQKISEKKAVR